MKCSSQKLFICVTISLMVLFGFLLPDISPEENAYAMGFLGNNSGSNRSSSARVAQSTPGSNPETLHENEDPMTSPPSSAPAPVPEPATWLLVGAGAAGMAAFKKKFKKK